MIVMFITFIYKIGKNKKHLLYIISFKENTFIYYSNDYKTIY
jgi:hypothetical protein